MHRIIVVFFFIHSIMGVNTVFAQTGMPTMQDFWDKKAYFQFVNRSRFPTVQKQLDGSVSTIWGTEGMNGGNDVLIKDGIWYFFHREYFYRVVPPGDICSTSGSTSNEVFANIARAVVRYSTDKGQTWSQETVILEPSGDYWDMCSSGLDGDAFYDASTNTWHYIYQCSYEKNPGNGQWGLCHATRVGATPLGLFTKDPNPPAVKSGQIWRKICTDSTKKCNQISGGNYVYDEGTPEFIEKDANGYFYISFHGYSNAKYGYRGVARTKDFKNWYVVAPDSIHDKFSCQTWNAGYDSGGCVGGGASTIFKEGNYYYQLTENPDKNQYCQCDQQWPYGLLRSISLTNTNWEQFSNNPIAYSSKQHHAISDGYSCDVTQNFPCNVQYQRLFKDTDGQIYLIFLKPREWQNGINEKVTGTYLYRLVYNAPLIDYEFREGSYYDYIESDIVSRYNSEMKVNNITWKEIQTERGTSKYSLVFNGSNSLVESRYAYPFTFTNNFSLEVKIKVSSLPLANSAFIAGVKNSYWLEVYPGGQLCAWVYTYNGDPGTPGNSVNNCVDVNADLNVYHDYLMTYKNSIFSFYRDGVLIGAKNTPNSLVWEKSGNMFQLGSSFPPVQNIYGCFTGEISSIKIYDMQVNPTPTITPTPPPIFSCATCGAGLIPAKSLGNANCDGKINALDFSFWKKVYLNPAASEAEKAAVDFNCQPTDTSHIVDLLDLKTWVGGYY